MHLRRTILNIFAAISLCFINYIYSAAMEEKRYLTFMTYKADLFSTAGSNSWHNFHNYKGYMNTMNNFISTFEEAYTQDDDFSKRTIGGFMINGILLTLAQIPIIINSITSRSTVEPISSIFKATFTSTNEELISQSKIFVSQYYPTTYRGCYSSYILWWRLLREEKKLQITTNFTLKTADFLDSLVVESFTNNIVDPKNKAPYFLIALLSIAHQGNFYNLFSIVSDPFLWNNLWYHDFAYHELRKVKVPFLKNISFLWRLENKSYLKNNHNEIDEKKQEAIFAAFFPSASPTTSRLDSVNCQIITRNYLHLYLNCKNLPIIISLNKESDNFDNKGIDLYCPTIDIGQLLNLPIFLNIKLGISSDSSQDIKKAWLITLMCEPLDSVAISVGFGKNNLEFWQYDPLNTEYNRPSGAAGEMRLQFSISYRYNIAQLV